MSLMNAVVLEKAGALNYLKLKSTPLPVPARDEVLVRISAAGLNHRDLWIVLGQYAKIVTPSILGSDGAGEIVALGENTPATWLGKRVLINPGWHWGSDSRAQQKNFQVLGMPVNGTQAEYISVPYQKVHQIPTFMNMAEAAALPLGGLTGYRALFVQGKIKKGHKILITGIGGGVATIMLKMAQAVGATVYVSSGDNRKLELAKYDGATMGVNYNDSNWWKTLSEAIGDGFDIIVDSAGGSGFKHLISLARPGGKVIFFGATRGNPTEINLRQIFWKQITLQGTTMGSDKDFADMLEFVTENKVKPLIHASYNLDNFKDAYKVMQEGKQFGKIILR